MTIMSRPVVSCPMVRTSPICSGGLPTWLIRFCMGQNPATFQSNSRPSSILQLTSRPQPRLASPFLRRCLPLPTKSSSEAVQRTPHSLLWLAAIQIVERNKNLPGLTPKDSFVATEAVESIIRQITQPQETTGELNIRNHLALGL